MSGRFVGHVWVGYSDLAAVSTRPVGVHGKKQHAYYDKLPLLSHSLNVWDWLECVLFDKISSERGVLSLSGVTRKPRFKFGYVTYGMRLQYSATTHYTLLQDNKMSKTLWARSTVGMNSEPNSVVSL